MDSINQATARELGVELKAFTWVRDPEWPDLEIYITEEHGSRVAINAVKGYRVVWKGFGEPAPTLEKAFEKANKELSYLEHSDTRSSSQH